jgi:NADH-quinone oxidoreductase subunit N
VTLLLGAAPKLATFAITFRLLVEGMLPLAVDWQQMLMVLAVLSIILGNVTAIAQTNIKRMLAYSTISHMGFMLLGMMSGVVDGNLFSAVNAYSSSLFYAVTYVITTLGSFGVIILLSRSGFEADTLEDFKGLNQRSPWFAAVMMIMMFSLAGIPRWWASTPSCRCCRRHGHRPDLAAGAGRGLLADRCLLLHPCGQGHVLR